MTQMMMERVAKFKGDDYERRDEARIAFCRGRDIAREGHNWGAQPAFSLEIRDARNASAWTQERRKQGRGKGAAAAAVARSPGFDKRV